MTRFEKVTSGVADLDRLLDGLYVGDNVIWYDDAGALAWVFCQNLAAASQRHKRPLIYVTFDRSPKNLLAKLGDLADNPDLIVMDCFTWGKGEGSQVFLDYYRQKNKNLACELVLVKNPKDKEAFQEVLYRLHSKLKGDVRFIFESLTGMQEIWGGEDEIIKFYSHACPRLYELQTIAYWIMEKQAHSKRLKAQINQIAQVVIDLKIKRGATSLSILKAENRLQADIQKNNNYWAKGLGVSIGLEKSGSGPLNIGGRIKDLRSKAALSQTDLARLVGVSASNISQVESGHIHPSIPGLVRMAEVLGVEVGSFFGAEEKPLSKMVFPLDQASKVHFSEIPADLVKGSSLLPDNLGSQFDAYLLELPPKKGQIPHFFKHKGPEMGFVLQGELELSCAGELLMLKAFDTVYLDNKIPSNWFNPGPEVAKILWLKMG